MLQTYFKSIKEKKIMCIVSAVVFVLFSALNLVFLREIPFKGWIVPEGLVCAFVLLLLLPLPKMERRIEISLLLVVSAVYLILVPKRMFLRTELPISTMENLYPGALGLNLCIILFIFFLLLFLSQKINIAFGATGILCMLFMLVNFYLTQFRGSAFSIGDLKAIGTAATVMGEYRYTITAEVWKSILYFLVFIALGFRLKVPFKGVRYHIAATAVAVAGMLGCRLYYAYSSAWETPGMDGNGTLWAGESPFGTYLYFAMTSDALGMEKESGYSDKMISEIGTAAEQSYESKESQVRPHIIMIMNEAWSDLRFLGNIETDREAMPFYDSLKQRSNVATGFSYVNIQGGMTCDSEFEALTGDTMTFLSVSAVPYQMQIDHKLSSMASVLGGQGYKTVAMHPSGPTSWNREDIYGYMGFDRTIFVNDFTVDYDFEGSYISDRCDFAQIIDDFENRDKSAPYFMFNVTIQNHSPFWYQTALDVQATKVGNTALTPGSEDGFYVELNTYLSLMNETDQALEKLITYFDQVQEPVIICMFGDHQPILSETFYNMVFEGKELSDFEKKAAQFATPYFIYKNYDDSITAYGDMSASHLGAAVCETAGVKLPTYYKFLLESRKSVPYLNRYTEGLYGDSEILSQYKILMYNQLMETDYRKDIFEVQ